MDRWKWKLLQKENNKSVPSPPILCNGFVVWFFLLLDLKPVVNSLISYIRRTIRASDKIFEKKKLFVRTAVVHCLRAEQPCPVNWACSICNCARCKPILFFFIWSFVSHTYGNHLTDHLSLYLRIPNSKSSQNGMRQVQVVSPLDGQSRRFMFNSCRASIQQKYKENTRTATKCSYTMSKVKWSTKTCHCHENSHHYNQQYPSRKASTRLK